MLVSIIPLFDEDIAVRAYSLFVQKKNYFLNPNLLGGVEFFGAVHVDVLEVIDILVMETLSNDELVFVQVIIFSV